MGAVIGQELEKKTNIPTPEIILDGRDKKIPHLVYERVEGEPIDPSKEYLNDLAYQAGEHLGELHENVRTFGAGHATTIKDQISPFNSHGSSWKDFYEGMLTERLERQKESNIKSEDLIERVSTIFNENIEIVEGTKEYRLLHNDYRLDNILEKDGDIQAIIDWDNAISGDPLYDFVKSEDCFSFYDVEEEFRSGYEEFIDVEEDSSYWFYKLGSSITGLEIVRYHQDVRDSYEDWQEDYLELFDSTLHQVEDEL